MKKSDIEDIKYYLYNYFKRNNKMPSKEQVAKRTNLTLEEVQKAYSSLQSQGYLKTVRVQKVPTVRTKANLPKMQSVSKEVSKIPISNVSQMDTDNMFGNLTVLVIRIVMLVIGAGAICLSVYYTSMWLSDFLPSCLAILLSSVMVGFSAMAFEIIIILSTERRILLSILFSFLWVVVLLFSMISTVAGQYNQRIQNDIAENLQKVDVNHRKAALDIYNNNERELLSQLEDKKKERAAYQKLLAEVDTLEERIDNTSGWVFRDTSRKLAKVDSDISEINVQLRNVRETKLKLLSSEDSAGLIEQTEVQAASFYVWMSTVFSIAPKFVEFWMSLFPAIFIDLIAPFSLAISLFLRKKGWGLRRKKVLHVEHKI
jgi:hypothetical protein